MNEIETLKAKIKAATLELTDFIESEILTPKQREKIEEIKERLSKEVNNQFFN